MVEMWFLKELLIKILNGHKSVTGDYLKDNSLIKLEDKIRKQSGKSCCKKSI